MDALHIAAAEALGAAEFVTGEKKQKPLFRVTSMAIRSLSG
jgi:predicted nucleic acid-binding protein